MAVRVAINGFGRIGRCVYRALEKQNNGAVEVVAVNDLADAKTLAHLLKWDSVHGALEADVVAGDGEIRVGSRSIRHFQERDPGAIAWSDLNVDVVLESTGFFTDGEKAKAHLGGSVKKVVISAPGKNVDLTVALGINFDEYDKDQHHIVSNASCTTNCLAPLTKVLHEKWGIERGFVTTAHAYTSDQRLLDAPHSDLRRARAAALNIIPTSTGAAKAIGLVMPDLLGKLDGTSLRVPVPTGSIVDLVATLNAEVSVDDVNAALREAAEGPMKGILEYSEAPLVSTDIVGNPHSSIVDGKSTMANGNMVKVLAWYDNEWGYSNRIADLLGSLL